MAAMKLFTPLTLQQQESARMSSTLKSHVFTANRNFSTRTTNFIATNPYGASFKVAGLPNVGGFFALKNRGRGRPCP
jgi:hypothetical protein